MSLAAVAKPPPTGRSGFNEWLFAHQQDHLAIVAGIQKVYGFVVPTYVIDPLLPQDLKGWALRHQNFHNDMNAVLGLDGSDLQEVDFQNSEDLETWFWTNFEEHRAAHNKLKV